MQRTCKFDGTEIKDVRIEGDQTIKAGVRIPDGIEYSVSNEVITLTSISFEGFFSSGYQLTYDYGGIVKTVLYDGSEILEEVETDENSQISFDGLKPNTLYQYAVYSFFDNLSGDPAGATLNVLYKRAFYTNAILRFDEAATVIGSDSIEFDLVWDEQAQSKVVKGIEVFCEGVKHSTVEGKVATGLLSGKSYQIVAAYDNLDGEEETVTLTATTLLKSAPSIYITHNFATKDTVSFEFEVVDEDEVGYVSAIKLYLNDVRAAL